ncbi:MAG: cell wall surface anchor family protein, partial [Candidatus Nomurabacteria bacterium]|nr:cell wall surface anchor family protein [Candidatus Nomurabacteria bacterium]
LTVRGNALFSDGTTVGTGGVTAGSILGPNSVYATSNTSGFRLANFNYAEQDVATTGSIQGMEGFAAVAHPSGTVAAAIATIGNVQMNSTATLTSAVSVQAGGNTSVAGTITTWKEFYAAMGNTGGSAIGTAYGLYVDTFPSGVTAKYGVYINDATASNYFAGKVGVGVTSPSGLFSLGGNISAAAWGANGINFQTAAATYTDTSTAASTTVGLNMVNSFGIPTLAASNTSVTYTNAATLYVAGAPAAGTNVTLTNPAALVVASGNVGIGTTSPTALLNLGGNISAPAWGTNGINFQTNAATYTDTSTASFGSAGNVAVNSFGTPTLATSSTSSLIITGVTLYVAGAPIVGAHATITNRLAFQVGSGNTNFEGNVGIGSGNENPAYMLVVGSSSVTFGSTVAQFIEGGGTCSVVPSTAGGITCSSDMNLKKNINNLSDDSAWSYNNNITTTNQSDLAKILALNPVSYNWNAETPDPVTGLMPLKHGGFIAQEVRQIFPDLVLEDPNTHLLSLSYSGLVPYTVEALKEMNLNITNIGDLTKTNTWRDSLLAWFGSTTNGIQNIFSKKVTTEQLCVGTADNQVCITKAQLQQLLQNSGTASATPITTSTTTSSTPTTTTSTAPTATTSTTSTAPTTTDTSTTTSTTTSSTTTSTSTTP